MKVFHIITNPILLISFYLVLLISGENFGNVYLFYILLALPYGGIHSMLAFSGIAILVFCYLKFKRRNKYLIEPLLNFAGLTCMLLSIYYFFHNDRSNFNISTFDPGLPRNMLIFFGLLSLLFVTDNILRLFGKRTKID